MKKVRGRDGEAHWEHHTIYSNVNNNNRRDAFSTLNEMYPPPKKKISVIGKIYPIRYIRLMFRNVCIDVLN